MPARTPADILPEFQRAAHAGDLDALLRLFEPNVTRAETNRIERGLEPLRASLAIFLAMKPTMALKSTRMVAHDDVALLHSSWLIIGTGQDGKPVSLDVRPIHVARRQADGTWRIAIDDPFGHL